MRLQEIFNLMFLMLLSVQLMRGKHFGLDHRIFPMTSNAFQQAWADVCKRAGVTGLTFHDLRHEAASRFDEVGLTKGEHDLMMGHFGKDMSAKSLPLISSLFSQAEACPPLNAPQRALAMFARWFFETHQSNYGARPSRPELRLRRNLTRLKPLMRSQR